MRWLGDVMLAVWLPAFTKGFVTMVTLIVAIGVQNAFVLRQGINRQATFVAATICFMCDVVLVSAGAAGLGALFAASRMLSLVIAFGGATFLAFYGLRALHAAKTAQGLDTKSGDAVPLRNTVMTALAVSLLNPHALLDTLVLAGGFAARYEGGLRLACALGSVTASGVWFYSLAYGARRLAPVLARPQVWRIIDLAIGLMMLSLAVSLAKDGINLL